MSKKHKGQTVTVEDKRYPVVREFKMYHHEWESDGTGWILFDDQKMVNRLVLSNHGTLFFAGADRLADKVVELNTAVADLRSALTLLL